MKALGYSLVAVFEAAKEHQFQLPLTSFLGRKWRPKQGFIASLLSKTLKNHFYSLSLELTMCFYPEIRFLILTAFC